MKTSTIPEQVAEYLHGELILRRWETVMPGRSLLAKELEVSTRSVQEALKILENQGILIPQGQGRGSRIVMSKIKARPTLRVQILLYDKSAAEDHYMLQVIHQLQEAGHVANFATKSLVDLNMNVKRVAHFVEKTEANGWIICAGPRDVLEWFAQQSVPAFSLFGRARGLNLPSVSPEKIPAESEALHRLIELGHRLIVRLALEERRKPVPGVVEQAFLDTLEASGIKTGPYNLPDWNKSKGSLQHCLETIFQHTPPTALIIDGAAPYFATYQYLSRRGFQIPEDVSLICCDPSIVFYESDPAVSHITWDTRPLVRTMVQWANKVACGKEDHYKALIKAKFIEGGTIGQVAK